MRIIGRRVLNRTSPSMRGMHVRRDIDILLVAINYMIETKQIFSIVVGARPKAY